MNFKQKIFSVLIVLVFMLGMFSYFPRTNMRAEASSSEIVNLLPYNFASSQESLDALGVNLSQTDSFTPFNNGTYSLMAGKSFKPELVGTDGEKVVNASLNISSAVNAVDVSTINNEDNLALKLWVNFDKRKTDITRDIEISLVDATSQTIIKWVLDSADIQLLIDQTEISAFDKMVFGLESLALVGWCNITLPLSKAEVLGEIITDNKLNFAKLNIKQLGGYIAEDQDLLFYDIKLVEDGSVLDTMLEKQDYANIHLKQNLNIIDDQKDYYKGEYFEDSLSKLDVFNACFVGRVNYLANENSNLLVVEADPEMGKDKIVTFSYGTGTFKIEQDSYKIKYCIKYNGKNIALISDSLMASSYGKGIWIEPITDALTKGKEHKLKYSVHEAFSGDSISFSSSDESILKIKSVDKINKYIIVECLSVGEVTITATINDDRLVGTDYEDSGIVNDGFTVEVQKEKKQANTTKIMLWIALGILVSGLIYVAVVEIIKVRKLEVK